MVLVGSVRLENINFLHIAYSCSSDDLDCLDG